MRGPDKAIAGMRSVIALIAGRVALFLAFAILGAAASLGLASLNAERSKERDARRLSDLARIQNALESYYQSHKAYPAHVNSVTSLVNDIQSLLVPSYLPSVPQDPMLRNGDPEYGYRYCADNTSRQHYTLMANLENAPASYQDRWCIFTTGPDDCLFSTFPRCD
jgi:type II secretory pathway pseudopilin PulG